MKRLILGTANFCDSYGIMNKKMCQSEIIKILKYCLKNNINSFDTAPAYGQHVDLVGNFLKKKKINLISKTPIIFDENKIDELIGQSIKKTLNCFTIESIETLLIHNVKNFTKMKPEISLKTLINLKNEGKVKKIGVSIYDAQEFDIVCEFFIPDVVQLPINILDQRVIKNGLLEKIKEKDCEIHARSIFLQGLLLSDYSKIPKKLSALKQPLLLIDEICERNSLKRLKLFLEFIFSIKEIDAVVFGVESKNNLVEIYNEIKNFKQSNNKIKYDIFSINNSKILDARNWS